MPGGPAITSRLTRRLKRFNPVFRMKKLLIPTFVACSLIVLLTGCIAIGTGPTSKHTNATLGQQLVDLKTAKDTGAITEAEYEAQKAKLLGSTPDSAPSK
jgi:Short C-terminal domain